MAVVGKNARIREALDYRLGTLVLNPVRRVTYGNLSFKPEVGEIYLFGFNLPARSDFAGVGNSPRRHSGIYQVSVYGPLDEGPQPCLEIADLVVEHFVSQNITRNSVTVRIGSFDGSGGLPWISPDVEANGWRNVPVSIPWWCDTF